MAATFLRDDFYTLTVPRGGLFFCTFSYIDMGDDMEFLKYGGMALLGVGALAIFICSIRGGKPLKSLFINALVGVAVLAIIDLTTKYTGVHIPINGYTAIGAVCYGVPAVCGFLVLPLIFK